MANATTVTRTGNFISLLFEDNGVDFLFSTDTTANLGGLSNTVIMSIMWWADAASDALVIRDGADDAAIVFSDEASDSANARIKYYGGDGGYGVVMNPSITVSQCTSLGAGILIFELG